MIKYFIIRDFRSTCSWFICRNAEGVHAHVSECLNLISFRVTVSLRSIFAVWKSNKNQIVILAVSTIWVR